MDQKAELYINQARKLLPGLAFDSVRYKTEGQANVVLLVDDQFVFRFPRNDAARRGLQQEVALLSVIPRHVDLPVPQPELHRDGCMVQRMIPGQPLDRAELMRQPSAVRERMMEQLAHFLYQLHRAPEHELIEQGVEQASVAEGPADAIALFHRCRRELFPHLKEYAQTVIREHFRPVLNDRLDLQFEPVLIHGDLDPAHILWDPGAGKLTGVLDFGMAGFGDSALDYAALLLSYGETPLRRMHVHHRSIGQKIDRARFWSFVLELQHALAGLESGEPQWFCSHLGTARDRLPIGTPWPERARE